VEKDLLPAAGKGNPEVICKAMVLPQDCYVITKIMPLFISGSLSPAQNS
jgi:hypothetical protein